jgi:ABC-type transport system involved in cytochrome bd biosynthesis fused ATPase/permease subunit
MLQSFFDAIMAAGIYRLLLLACLVVPCIGYLLLTRARRRRQASVGRLSRR